MELVVDENLETLLQEAEEIRAAVKEISIEEIAEEAPTQVPEEFSAVMEQEYDPKVIEKINYTNRVNVNEKEDKNVYYVRAEEEANKYEKLAEKSKERTEQAQEVVTKSREATFKQQTYVILDNKESRSVERMKIENPGLFFMACEGDISMKSTQAEYHSTA